MISQGGKKILERFVTNAKNLLMQNITELLQQYYGIWADGHSIAVESLPNQDTDIVHTARMLRERLGHLLAALPENKTNKEKLAVGQLISEQAFTQLNRFCALRMCEERDLILESIRRGYDSGGFQGYDAVASMVPTSKYQRYKWYLQSIFDELSIELPAVFDRYSPYGLVFPDESTLMSLLDMINDEQLSAWYDEQNNTTVNFWKEDETLGWMFQDYNSLEERRQMREESNKPRNSREMAVRNQFFTPEYIVRFLTDNSLGRIWYEMTGGQSRIGEEQCKYMVRRPNEQLTERTIKEPTEILSLDPTCGSMHFGIYLYEVYEYIYMDAWDNQPKLLHEFREIHTRDSFLKEVPRLILEKNIYGCEIDPRALQLAALSLWLRAQKSFAQMGIQAGERPLIKRSNLVLAEAMPGNKRLLNGLMEELDKPMQRLITKVWEKMKFVGEAGLLFKMEQEIDAEIDYLRQNWAKVNQYRYANLFSTDEEKARIEAENATRKALKQNKEGFFNEITIRLQEALQQLSAKLSEEEGYENALFSEDATRGFAFIELCQKRFDCIVMNPPFGEGSENTSEYLDEHYPAWCRNLVCAFFDRMQELLSQDGLLGAIYDRTVFIKALYEDFRKKNLCGFLRICADTGWYVLDANVETTATVMSGCSHDITGTFIDVRDISQKDENLLTAIQKVNEGEYLPNVYLSDSIDFINLPNSVIGYNFDKNILNVFKFPSLQKSGFEAKGGHKFHVQLFVRLFWEVSESDNFEPVAGNGKYYHYYAPYRDMAEWKNNGIRVSAMNLIRNPEAQRTIGTYYGERGDIVDGQILKPNMFTTQGYIGIPAVSKEEGLICTSFLNSILSQFFLNLYSGGHKMTTYVNLIPIPPYKSKYEDIINTVRKAIVIKRKWFSLDESNLEYHGLIAQMNVTTTVDAALDDMQERLTADYARYQGLVKENDDLWMDLAGIEHGSDFRKTLNDYKQRRPYEELLSIDGASSENVIDKKVMAQEIVMELVGMAFGRWDSAYAKGEKAIPEFGDVFDALPFMPVVSLEGYETAFPIPEDGILTNQIDSPFNLASRVSEVMRVIWNDQADDIEYELCQLIGCRNLQTWFENPNGFFDYHFKRYTKSRRKAPIYWPLTSEDGSITYWVYYPKLTKNTLPSLVVRLRQQQELLRSALNASLTSHDKGKENEVRSTLQQTEKMMEQLNAIIATGYAPCHDDGVPVTAAPLYELFAHRQWRQECESNMNDLQEGEYDWSHLAMSLYPARITAKAKKDWCMALTHGLEHLCENKPRERRARSRQPEATQQTLNLE
jgi:hypothetical protein